MLFLQKKNPILLLSTQQCTHYILNFVNKRSCENLFSFLLYKYLHNILDFAFGAMKPKIFPIWPLQKNFAEP